MSGKYILVGLTHSVCVALILIVLHFNLPCYVTCFSTCVANFILFLIIARSTYGLTKRKLLSDKVRPENKAVLITGCSSGFGHGLAMKLDAKGYHVFASCRNPSGPGVEQLQNSCSDRLKILRLDVTKDESVKNALEFVKDNLGTCELWALVNNAGIYKGLSVELTDVQVFQDSMEANAIGPVRVTKAFLPLLRKSRGRIVNVSSVLGRFASPFVAAYNMSKFAASAFNECLRRELEVWGIRVIDIRPEIFTTPLSNPVRLAKDAKITLDSNEKHIYDAYGEKYMVQIRILVENIGTMASTKVYKVLDALELAISLEYPDSVYCIYRNSILQIGVMVLDLIPTVLSDLIIKYIFSALGCPKPIEANKYQACS